MLSADFTKLMRNSTDFKILLEILGWWKVKKGKKITKLKKIENKRLFLAFRKGGENE